MSIFLIKSILSLFFLLAGLSAVISMFTIMGRQEKKMKPVTLRKIHKTSGRIFFILLLVISYFCLKYLAMAGDQISTRASLHSVLAFSLVIILLLKISIVKKYKLFLKFAPTLGMIIFVLTFVVFCTSAGYYFLKTASPNPASSDSDNSSPVHAKTSIDHGEELFISKCSSCHFAEKEDLKNGPGLANLFKKDTLPSSGRPANRNNIKEQLFNPFQFMPSFKNLTEKELADLFVYLESL